MNAASMAKRYIASFAYLVFSLHVVGARDHHPSLLSKIEQLNKVQRRLDAIMIALGQIGWQLAREGLSDGLAMRKETLIKDLQKNFAAQQYQDVPLLETVITKQPKKQGKPLWSSSVHIPVPTEMNTQRFESPSDQDFQFVPGISNAETPRKRSKSLYCGKIQCWQKKPCLNHRRKKIGEVV